MIRKWTKEERQQIVTLHNEGLLYAVIAERFGVTRQAISGVIYRYRRGKVA